MIQKKVTDQWQWVKPHGWDETCKAVVKGTDQDDWHRELRVRLAAGASCGMMVPYHRDDPVAVLNEVACMLRPGGSFLIRDLWNS